VRTGADGSEIIVKNKDGEYCARDLNDYLFPILDWGLESITKFVKYFEMGQGIWNRKFLIIPPADFDTLDYTSSVLPGYVMRPNILCLFRMSNNMPSSKSRNYNVVRINPAVFEDPKYQVPNYRTSETKPAKWGFRSHARLLTDRDVFNENLGHELGHALDEGHILALKGDELVISFHRRRTGIFLLESFQASQTTLPIGAGGRAERRRSYGRANLYGSKR